MSYQLSSFNTKGNRFGLPFVLPNAEDKLLSAVSAEPSAEE